MSFFDEGEKPRTATRSRPPQPRRASGGSRRRSTDDRTLLLRRGGAAVVVLAVLIGLVLGIKALLHHQAIAGLRSYDTDVNNLVANELSVRDEFFHLIDNSFNSPNPTGVPEALQQQISVEHTLYEQAQGWSVPAQMVAAQRDLVTALGLRYDALQGIAAQMSTALGVSGNQTEAIRLIAGDMETLLGSDVLYAQRVAPLIDEALAKAGITGMSAAASEFLPDVNWEIPEQVAYRILGFVPAALCSSPGAAICGGTGSGSPGHELVSVTVPSLGQLQGGATTYTKIPYTAAGVTFVLTVLNTGSERVPGVMTKLFFTKAGLNTSCLTAEGLPIRLSVPGSTYTPSIVFAGGTCASMTPYFNTVLKMTAEVVPLRGETDTSNNFQYFYVEFTHS